MLLSQFLSSLLSRLLVSGIACSCTLPILRCILFMANLILSHLRVRAFKDAAKHIKMADDLIHRQHQTIRHLQRSIDSIDYKSRLIERMDLELAALESKRSVKGALTLDNKPL